MALFSEKAALYSEKSTFLVKGDFLTGDVRSRGTLEAKGNILWILILFRMPGFLKFGTDRDW